ncbi:NAD(+) synthase [Thioalkalivibrio sp. HK1]|uniref:NAD(+) synthase n=1 Tax=Thioalkalivibrio sp. HK1 TaxID=1469245 RepID=UPI00046EDB4E|nr:NAD(+) synthase [Thioalkalivibrio sp. HK1]
MAPGTAPVACDPLGSKRGIEGLDSPFLIALAQMEVQAGRPDRNVERMLRFIDRARTQGAAIVAFPELCIPGYFLGDLWEIDALVEDCARFSQVICEASEGITVVFGNVAFQAGVGGEDGRLRKFNAAWVCHDGSFVERPSLPAPLPDGVQPKTLHPNYRIFDDDRHFHSLRKIAAETGTALFDWMVPWEIPLTIAGGRTSIRLGVQLCEDLWHLDYRDRGAPVDTLQAWDRAGADLVINLSASPWTQGKNDKRNRVVREAMAGSRLPLFYVNLVGAQNNGKNVLVFDGGSSAYRPDGSLAGEAASWQEDLLLLDLAASGSSAIDASDRESALPFEAALDPSAPAPCGTPRQEMDDIAQAIIVGLRHFDAIHDRKGRYLVGVSGGVDSSVVACLLQIAFGPQRVFAVNLPTRFNADLTKENARILCAELGIESIVCPIEDLYRNLSARLSEIGFEGAPGNQTVQVEENIQARIRGADMLAGIAAKCGLFFTNNGNKTETALGYATLYGDVNGAIAPIADLYKPQVLALAEHLNRSHFRREVIPANLLDGTVPPSAELSADHDITCGRGDPIKYGYHDALLTEMIEYRYHLVDLLRWYCAGELQDRIGWRDEERFRQWFPDHRSFVEDLEELALALRRNCFKRIQAPPIIVLSKRAFGFDLRESQLPAWWPQRYMELKKRLLEEG